MVAQRTPWQGVWNILRFNWHFYFFAFLLSILLGLCTKFFPDLQPIVRTLNLLLFTIIAFSLLVSWYVYDLSPLYQGSWIKELFPIHPRKILSIHSGFDETSEILVSTFPSASFSVFDFYDAEKHTEVSIKRARAVYPPYPNTIKVQTENLPLTSNSMDLVVLFLSAHEIRSSKERIVFFNEVHRILTVDGKVLIIEHLRDLPNFLAYTLGFFHFFTRNSWVSTFYNSAFKIEKETEITPFIHVFILEKNGATP